MSLVMLLAWSTPLRLVMAMSWNGITDPWRSAYPEDTVMAYRNPARGFWPEFFTTNDLQALIQIWGAESSGSVTDTRSLVVSGGTEVSHLTSQWLGSQ